MMAHDFLIGGVILSPIVPQLLIALLLTVLLSILLMRLGFTGWYGIDRWSNWQFSASFWGHLWP